MMAHVGNVEEALVIAPVVESHSRVQREHARVGAGHLKLMILGEFKAKIQLKNKSSLT